MPEAEKSRVLESLRNSGIDVSIDPTTGDVLVPVGDYHSSRMTLAAQGLPAAAGGGYDQLDSIQLGSSRSVEAALKQSQSGATRSISEIELVLSTRVHLAILKSVRPQNRRANGVSIFTTCPRTKSGRSQVEAIVHWSRHLCQN